MIQLGSLLGLIQFVLSLSDSLKCASHLNPLYVKRSFIRAYIRYFLGLKFPRFESSAILQIYHPIQSSLTKMSNTTANPNPLPRPKSWTRCSQSSSTMKIRSLATLRNGTIINLRQAKTGFLDRSTSNARSLPRNSLRYLSGVETKARIERRRQIQLQLCKCVSKNES